MHGVIATQRQSAHHDLRLLAGADGTFDQGILENLVIEFGIQPAVVDSDAGAAGPAALHRLAETLIEVRLARAMAVFERHQESARMQKGGCGQKTSTHTYTVS